MKISLESLMKGFKANQKDVEAGEELTPFTGESGPGVHHAGAGDELNELIRDYQVANDNGITVYPTPITLGQDVKVNYRGLLSQAGAEQVYLHCGFGIGDWKNVQDIPMYKQNDGTWTAKVGDVNGERFNFCFHDNVMNWDNNNGKDWSFIVHSG